MKAAVFAGAENLAVGEFEPDACGSNQVRLDVHACGVCGSNMHQWHDPLRVAPRFRTIPGALGHEVSGIVSEVGVDVTTHTVGDQVVIDPGAVTGCGQCDDCASGAYWFCRRPGTAQSFGFADSMLVPAFAAVRTPGPLPHHVAALTEPISCGVHAVRHSWTAREAGTVEGLRVAVLGAGMLGIGATLAARQLGAAEVVTVARHPHQRRAAMAVGATEVFDSELDDLESRLRRLRPNLVVEAVGSGRTLALASNIVAARGEVAVLGQMDEPERINCARSLTHEVRYFFAVSYASRDGVHDFDIALRMMSAMQGPLGELPFQGYALDEIGQAFDDLANKRTHVNRVMIMPSRGEQ